MQFLFHELEHAVVDTAKMVPFLFLAYLAIEWIERRGGEKIQSLLAGGGRYGFAPGAVLGLIPQCGFSAMAANFYASHVVTLGTLLAVFLATSDEAVPILLANPDRYGDLAKLLLVKLIWALLVGFVVDVVLRKALPKTLRGGYGGEAGEVDCHDHDEEDGLLLATLKHTLNITAWVLGFTFVFGVVVELLGEARIEAAFAGLGLFQPVVAALFGLIPNCASSVLLTQLYLADTITFGSVLAGLCANAGIGLTVLFKNNRPMRQNVFILLLLFGSGVLLGLLVQLLGI